MLIMLILSTAAYTEVVGHFVLGCKQLDLSRRLVAALSLRDYLTTCGSFHQVSCLYCLESESRNGPPQHAKGGR